MKRKKGDMGFALFKKIVKDCVRNRITEIITHGSGEPLLNRQLVSFIRYAKQSGVKKVSFSTNAMLMDGKTASALVKSGLDEIIVSCDGHDNDSYGKVRRGGNYSVLKDNLNGLIETRNRLGSKKPIIILQMILFGLTKNSGRFIKKEWTGRVDEINIKNFDTFAGAVKQGQTEKYSPENVPEYAECKSFERDMMVFWDGRVPLCVRDVNGVVCFGNLKKRNLMGVWNSPARREILRRQKEGGDLILCGNCREKKW